MSTQGKQPSSMKTDDEGVLLPEEEQLYREFEMYLNAISQEVALPLIQQIEEASRKLRHVVTPLQTIPREMQGKLDSSLQQLAKMSHESAAQMQQKLDSSLQQLAKMSHDSAAQMQQKLDSSLQQLAKMSHESAAQMQQKLDSSLQQLAELSRDSTVQMQQKLDSSLQQMVKMSYGTNLLMLRNLLIGVIVLACISVMLQMLISFRVWR